MYFKIMWLLSGILLFLFAPLKIASVFNTLDFVESGWFIGAFVIILVTMYLVSRFSRFSIDNLEIKKSIPLGIISLLISASFFFCISNYYSAKTLYDFEWQPIAMSLFSILSLITFLVMAFVHFTGKNLFSKLPFLLFCPVFWFAFDMILFLSIQNDNSDIYDIALTAFLSLFFLYYTQVFSTSSKYNIAKLVIYFGIPSFIFMLIKCVPVFIRYIGNYSDFPSDLDIATCSMQALVSFYILFVVIDAFKQVSKSLKLENN